MYVRFANVRRGSKVYRYTQLVESFRRPDGKPTNRVVANLGALDDVAVENLRAALEASRRGPALVLPDPALAAVPRPRAVVHENLRYLDIAVLLKVWREAGLDGLLERSLPAGDRTVAASEILTALVLQRCVAPASKLAAERWYPTTALPELQAIQPTQFNNARVHRALSALDAGEADLQAALPALVRQKEGPFTALFIDATDTWFVGKGPPLAQKGRDKEGIYRRRVGLVLLCDHRGYPLRWHTLSGRYHDPTALLDMAREAAALPWTKGVPVVMDRAAGNAAATEFLHASGLRYVTALPDPELISSGVPIPWEVLDPLQAETEEEPIRARLRAAGFTAVHDDRYILDLGVFQKTRSAGASRVPVAVDALRILAGLELGPTRAAVAARLGISTRHLQRHMPLRSLTAQVRSRIQVENVERLALSDLVKIASSAPEEQSKVLDALLAAADGPRRTAQGHGAPAYPARAVLSFSPERFLADRRNDREHIAAIEALVADVNRRLGHRSNRRTDGSALAEVEHELRRFGLRGVFTPLIETAEGRRRVVLTKDDHAWAQRRHGDGINVVLANPEVDKAGEELVNQYFAKDAIEKDFQIIKSTIELRPVHHRSDPKLRAHVSICVLALLLVRIMNDRLKPAHISSTAALEMLETVRLNLLVEGKTPFYTVTRPHATVAKLLRTLDMPGLVDDAQVSAAITPR